MTRSRALLAMSLPLLLAGCTKEPPQPSTAEPAAASAAEALPDSDTELAEQLIEDGAIVIDTRSQDEYDAGHVEGALLIPHDEIPERLDEVLDANGGDKHKPIVVYCRSGKRAGIAKEALVEGGFDQVTNVGGVKELCGTC